MEKPFLYFALANSSTNPLPALSAEMDGIKKALGLFAANDEIIWSADEFASRENLLSSLERMGISKSPKMIHFSGHAQKDLLQLSDKTFQNKELSIIFKEISNVKLVFLNACATEALNSFLLNQVGVEAIISTSDKVNDTLAKDFAIKFYETLALPNTKLATAFERTCLHLNLSINEASATRGPSGVSEEEDEVTHEKLNTWNLHYKNEQAAQWVFNSGFSENINNPDKGKLWQTYEAAQEELSQFIAASEQQISDLQAKIDQEQDEDKKDDWRVDKKLILRDIANEKQKVIQKLNEILYFNQDNIKAAFDEFHFTKEISDLNNKHLGIPNGAYILQGTENCGLGFFSKKIAYLKGWNASKEAKSRLQNQPILVNLNPITESLPLIDRLKRDLKITENINGIADIAKAFYKSFYNKRADFLNYILIFDATNLDDDDLSIILKEFWLSFNAELQKDKDKKRNFLLLIITHSEKADKDFSAVPRNFTELLPTADNNMLVYVAEKVSDVTEDSVNIFCLQKAAVFNEAATQGKTLFFNSQEPYVIPTLLKMAAHFDKMKGNSTDLEKEVHNQNKLTFARQYEVI